MGDTSPIGPRALQAWNEGVTDKEVLMSWWGGLICAVVASIISYYCVAKYADFLAVMRAKATALEQLKETPESESEEGSYVEERRSPRSISGRVRVVTIKCSAIVFFFFGLVAFVVLDLASLATLPLNLVVPTVMLFIVWGTLYQLKVSPNRTQFLVSHGMRRGMAVLLLVFVAVGTGPKVLYRVYILNKLIWDVKTIAYTVSFCFVALLLHMLRWSPRLAMYVLHVTGLCEGDVHTIIRALLAGTLGGQGLVLLKIVAEFSENAIFDRVEFKVSPATTLVMVVAVVATLMHVYSFHQMLNGRGRANVKLLVPVYRFALLVSGSVGAVVYLGEWTGTEATMLQTGVYWIALVGLAVICLNDAYEALRDVQVMERPECDLETGATTGTENLSQSASQTPGISNEGQSSLWDLGEGACRLRGTTEVYEDDMFYIASSRSLFGKPQVSPEKCNTKPATRHLEVVSPSDTNLPLPALNLDYPAVERSMLSELGKENPHANGPNQGRWSDPGSQKGLWKVRGKTYLHDKVKVSAGATMMKVAGLQWSYNPKNLVSCIGGEPGEFVQRFHAGRKDRPFMLVINFTVPSLGNHCMYLVPREGLEDKRFFQMLDSFVNSPSDASRNERFKFIPSVLEGSYFVRRAVGHTPALLANKLATKYYASWDRKKTSISTATARGHWFEISVDVGSSLVARSIMGTVKSYASNLVLRFAYLIQSNSDEELPERVLAGVDFHRPVTSPKPNVSLINPAAPSVESPGKHATGDSSSTRPTLSTLGPQSKEQLPTHRAPSPNEMDTESNFELFVRDGVFDEVGYDTDCSFRSLMDDEDEPEAGASPDAMMLNDSDEGFVEARSEPQVENEALDVDYPVPEGTMVVPKDHPNPHASVGKSFYVDSGLKAGGWNIRGPTYNVDRIKVPCEESRMMIAAMDWHYAPDEPIHHISAMPGGFIEKHHAGREDRPFLLVINFLVPSVGNFVTYLRRNTDILDPVFDEMLAAFIHNEDDNYRKERLKLIPGVLEGSYFVRKAVGAKPALLCKKLATDFYRGDNYFEVNIDVGSTVIGSRIFSAVKGFASSLVLHLGVALESKTRRELPERLLFGIDVYRPVMKPGNEFTGALVQT